jgi:hypothetical protein
MQFNYGDIKMKYICTNCREGIESAEIELTMHAQRNKGIFTCFLRVIRADNSSFLEKYKCPCSAIEDYEDMFQSPKQGHPKPEWKEVE